LLDQNTLIKTLSSYRKIKALILIGQFVENYLSKITLSVTLESRNRGIIRRHSRDFNKPRCCFCRRLICQFLSAGQRLGNAVRSIELHLITHVRATTTATGGGI